jgi:hydrogenase nickel incorporation protein HypB
VKKLNPEVRIFPVSAKTGEGMLEFEAYLRGQYDGRIGED